MPQCMLFGISEGYLCECHCTIQNNINIYCWDMDANCLICHHLTRISYFIKHGEEVVLEEVWVTKSYIIDRDPLSEIH